MTSAQLTYPLIAAAEVLTLGILRLRPSRAQNVEALRLWLRVQVVIFCILEPGSFLSASYYTRLYFGCSVISAAADLVVLYSIFSCLESDFRAFGSVKAWASLAVLTGLLFCFAAELPLPIKARGINTIWLTMDQAFGYLRISSLIALALYGWLRASSWPRDLAWTWLAMALYSITESVIIRSQIVASNTRFLEWVTSAAAILQLAGWWLALAYAPKPLTSLELEALSVIPSPHL
jgi:hypothetical protein